MEPKQTTNYSKSHHSCLINSNSIYLISNLKSTAEKKAPIQKIEKEDYLLTNGKKKKSLKEQSNTGKKAVQAKCQDISASRKPLSTKK